MPVSILLQLQQKSFHSSRYIYPREFHSRVIRILTEVELVGRAARQRRPVMVAPPHRGSRYFLPCVLVELVKVPIIDTTKVRVRWFPQLEGDPRRCDFSESLDIARELLDEHLNGWLDPRK